MPYGKGTYGSKVGRPKKKKSPFRGRKTGLKKPEIKANQKLGLKKGYSIK